MLDPAGGLTTMKYDVGNRLIERSLPNAVKSVYQYDDLDRVESITHTNADGDVLASVTYEREGIGEPTKITREDGTYTKLEYDESLRVTKESFFSSTGTLVEETSYIYDAAGKRTATTTTVGTQTDSNTYNYTVGYQLDSVTGSNGADDYQFDANGHLTLIERDGTTLDLNHDAQDRLTSVENETTGSTISYTYDAQGRRVAATEGTEVRQFLVAPAMGGGLESTDLIADGNGNLISNYVYAGGASPFMMLDANGNPVYYLTDGMGSVIGLANRAGMEVGDFRYDSFGNVREEWGGVIGSTRGDFRFQGQWLEEGTGIYHFRARDYDAQTGAFLSRDPIDIVDTEPESFNPYQFVYNNPYVYSDPTGMFTITELNAANHINQTLQSYSKQQAVDFLKQATGELFSNIALGIINQILPGTADGNDLFNWSGTNPADAGNYLESFLRDELCKLLPTGSVLSQRLWLTPQIQYSSGKVVDPGFNCGPSGGLPNNPASNPEFLFEEGNPMNNVLSNPNSYLIGDVKISVAKAHDYMKTDHKQWQAMANHAAKYQASRFASYITFRWTPNAAANLDLPGWRQSTLLDMQRIAVSNGVILFVANLSSK